MRIEYRVKSGAKAGSIHTPHRYGDGTYVVSKTRYKKDYIYISSLEEVLKYIQNGYRLRVSDPLDQKSPSLVLYRSLNIIES